MATLARTKAHVRRVAAGVRDLTYDAQALALGGLKWYTPMKPPLTAVTGWPSLATVIAGDYATTMGTPWFLDWCNDSGLAPATYALTVTPGLAGAKWFSPLDHLDP